MARPSCPDTVFRARAPGSLMLMGEYAVLAGYPAIVGAIDCDIEVVLTPRDDQLVVIDSSLGHLTQSLAELSVVAPFEYVLTALHQQRPPQGLTLTIQNEFDSTLGLGSSAAVTVATLCALYQWQQRDITPHELHAQALAVVRAVQGSGSGADVAASVYGGILAYRPDPFEASPLPTWPGITVLYSGSKTTTTDALARFKLTASAASCRELGELSIAAIAAMQQQDWPRVGNLMRAAHQGLVALGVTTPRIDDLIGWLEQTPGIHGAKISGSGLGDCVIGLGSATASHPSQLTVQLGGRGALDANKTTSG